MYTSHRYLCCLPLLLVAACGDTLPATPDAGDPGIDAPHPDAPPDAPPVMKQPLERLDWRTTRGDPLAASTVTVSAADPNAPLFALSGDRFVTRSECLGAQCTYTWHNLAGTPGIRRANLLPVTAGGMSPDGKRALLVAMDEMEACTDVNGQFEASVARGTLQLLDLATGVTSFELAIRSNLWSAPPFTPFSDWFFAAPIEGTACLAATTGYRSTTSPFAPPPGVDPTAQILQVIDARRWLVLRVSDTGGTETGLVDPLTAGSFALLGGSPKRFEVTGGWGRVYFGFGELAQEVVSLPPTGGMRQTTLRDEDWFAFGSQGRWIRVCQFLHPDGYRDCRVVDALAQAAPVNFRVTITADHPDDAVLLEDGAVVFVGPTDDGSRAVQRIELTTGRREVLHPGTGTLRPLGDGAGALLLQNGAAWLIEDRREELLAETVRHVFTTPRSVLPVRSPGRQDDVAVLALSSDGAQFTLAILDMRTRRLVTLTDNAYVTPPPPIFPIPFLPLDGCGQPWTTRHGGNLFEGFGQQPHHLFFVEQGQPATMWLLPIDLSAPPRRLAELTGSPTLCHAPLASPDGRRVGFAETSVDGTTSLITLSQDP